MKAENIIIVATMALNYVVGMLGAFVITCMAMQAYYQNCNPAFEDYIAGWIILLPIITITMITIINKIINCLIDLFKRGR